MGKYFDVTYMIQSFPTLLAYVHVTVFITIVSAFLGILLGSIIAIVRIKRISVLSRILIVFISFMRGTPFLVQLFLIYFGVPEVLNRLGFDVRNVPGLLYVLIVFLLHVAAYSAEIMRSSINAVAKGEKEAALALGLTEIQSYYRIILPQAFTLAIPALINTVIGVIKGSSLIFNVGVVDMMRKADLMGSNSMRSLELYVDVAIIYCILIVIISLAGQALEKRYRVEDRYNEKKLQLSEA